jgi:hypothetical protein
MRVTNKYASLSPEEKKAYHRRKTIEWRNAVYAIPELKAAFREKVNNNNRYKILRQKNASNNN